MGQCKGSNNIDLIRICHNCGQLFVSLLLSRTRSTNCWNLGGFFWIGAICTHILDGPDWLVITLSFAKLKAQLVFQISDLKSFNFPISIRHGFIDGLSIMCLLQNWTFQVFIWDIYLCEIVRTDIPRNLYEVWP